MTTADYHGGGTRRVFDGDATVDAVLGASGLPRELQDLVRLVLSHCRLSKREKSQAAAMLCDRFAEQLDAGRTVQQITGELGEPRAVARALSKDVRRNRPLSVRIFRRVVQGVVLCILLLLAVYGYYFVQFNFGTPNIARNYAQEHNDRVLARPESERAWPIYRQLLPGWKQLAYTKEEGTEGYPDLKPGTPGWDAAVANLKDNAAAIETLRRAARLPVLGCPLRQDADPFIDSRAGITGTLPIDTPVTVASNPPLLEIQLAHLGKMRSFARTLKFDAMYAATIGDGRRVTDDITAMLGLGAQIRDSQLLISDLVAVAVTAVGLNTLGTILDKHPGVLSDDQLAELAAALAPAPGGKNPYQVRFLMERQMMLDLLQRSFSDNGKGDGVLVAEGLRFFESLSIAPAPAGTGSSFGLAALGPLLSAAMASRDEMWQYYDEHVQAVERFGELPLWERKERVADPSAGQNLFEKLRLFLANVVLPALEKATVGSEFVVQERDAMRIAIALEQFRRARGNWPAALGELVPAYLAEVPPDRYTGKPLGYVLVDGKPRIYSVGVDRVDDGGKAMGPATADYSWKWMPPSEAAAQVAQLQSGKRVPGLKDFRGDWFLWPQPPEPEEEAAPTPMEAPEPAAPEPAGSNDAPK